MDTDSQGARLVPLDIRGGKRGFRVERITGACLSPLSLPIPVDVKGLFEGLGIGSHVLWVDLADRHGGEVALANSVFVERCLVGRINGLGGIGFEESGHAEVPLIVPQST